MAWVELNDWILEHYPKVHEATRYLTNMDNQYDCWLSIYNKHNKETKC